MTGTNSSSKQQIPVIYTLEQIERVTQDASFRERLIDGISRSFVAFHRGGFYAAPIQTLGAPPMAAFVEDSNYAAQTCVKSGYFANNPYYVIKVAAGGTPLPNSGLMQVYSQSTGRLQAILLDEGVLTELRTAAVGALAVRLFAPTRIHCIGIVGTGVQARYQLSFLHGICPNVLVWGRTEAHARAFQTEMSAQGWNVEIATHADELLARCCEVIVTTTCARGSPVLGTTSGVRPSARGVLITCIGSDAPGKCELDERLLRQADRLVADHVPQSLERGEFQVFQSSPSPVPILSLGSLIENKHGNPDELFTIMDSSGVALQDCVVAQMVYESLLHET